MNMPEYLEALGRAAGREVLCSESGNATCVIDGSPVLLQWHADDQSFLVHVDIGLLDKLEPAETYRRLLAANYMLAENKGATLSLDDVSGLVGLCRAVCIRELSPCEFVLGVKNLVVLAGIWKARLADWRGEAGVESESRSEAPAAGGVRGGATYSSSSPGPAPRREPFWNFGVMTLPRYRRWPMPDNEDKA